MYQKYQNYLKLEYNNDIIRLQASNIYIHGGVTSLRHTNKYLYLMNLY